LLSVSFSTPKRIETRSNDIASPYPIFLTESQAALSFAFYEGTKTGTQHWDPAYSDSKQGVFRVLNMIVWLLALYGACVAAWNVFSSLWKRKRHNLTPILGIVLVQNGADLVEGCLAPLIKGSVFLQRELELIVIDLESTDETFRILEKLEKRSSNLQVISCTEQDAAGLVTNLLQGATGFVCYIDLRTCQNPQDVASVFSRACRQ
jgi:hypothetical protein